jgi:hypothetical protein
MRRVVPNKSAGSFDLLRIAARVQYVSKSSASHPSIGSFAGPAIDPVQCASGIVSLSSQSSHHFQSATAASNLLQGGPYGRCHEVAFIDPGISDADAYVARSLLAETLSTTATRKREIAFIDRDVDYLATLLAGIRPDVEPILLSNDEPAPRRGRRSCGSNEFRE